VGWEEAGMRDSYVFGKKLEAGIGVFRANLAIGVCRTWFSAGTDVVRWVVDVDNELLLFGR
jgi:hypothetical protein